MCPPPHILVILTGLLNLDPIMSANCVDFIPRLHLWGNVDGGDKYCIVGSHIHICPRPAKYKRVQ